MSIRQTLSGLRLDQLASLGLEFVRVRFGDKYRSAILRQGKSAAGAPDHFRRIGRLAGLNAAETNAVAAKSVSELPFRLRMLLIILAVVGYLTVYGLAKYVEANAVYMPGTLYASIGPKDFYG